MLIPKAFNDYSFWVNEASAKLALKLKVPLQKQFEERKITKKPSSAKTVIERPSLSKVASVNKTSWSLIHCMIVI